MTTYIFSASICLLAVSIIALSVSFYRRMNVVDKALDMLLENTVKLTKHDMEQLEYISKNTHSIAMIVKGLTGAESEVPVDE